MEERAMTRGMSETKAIVLAFAVFSALMLGAIAYMERPSWGVVELRKANPGWTIEGTEYTPIHLDDGGPAGEVLVGGDDAGPYRVARVDCEEVRKAFPSWFVLPDAPLGNCARLGDPPLDTLVLNMRTTIGVPALWETLYEPTADRLHLGYSGGSSGSRSKADGTPQGSSAMGYAVDPPEGSHERKVAIEAMSDGRTTTAIFTFRPEPRP